MSGIYFTAKPVSSLVISKNMCSLTSSATPKNLEKHRRQKLPRTWFQRYFLDEEKSLSEHIANSVKHWQGCRCNTVYIFLNVNIKDSQQGANHR